MTKLLDDAVDAVRRLPPNAQDAIARMLRTITDDTGGAEEIPAEHLAAVLEGLAQAERGEFLSDEQAQALWAKHGL